MKDKKHMLMNILKDCQNTDTKNKACFILYVLKSRNSYVSMWFN